MKVTINGKRYDSEKCEIIAEKEHFNNGNFSGLTNLLLASNGEFLIETTSNGQDWNRRDGLYIWEDDMFPIDMFDLTDKQEQRCVELGLIEMVD